MLIFQTLHTLTVFPEQFINIKMASYVKCKHYSYGPLFIPALEDLTVEVKFNNGGTVEGIF
jgi:hypothetical protein